MHEMAITRHLIQLVQAHASEANTSKVRQINLIVGQLSGYVCECVQTYFDLLAKGTIMEAARLSFEIVSSTGQCRDCNETFEVEQSKWICPKCNGTRIQLAGGNELLVDSIEVE